MGGQHVAVLGSGQKMIGFTFRLLTWTERLTLITLANEGEIDDQQPAQLASFHLPILDREIVELEGDPKTGKLEQVRFADGIALACDALFFNLGTLPTSNLHEMLGCRLDRECGLVWVDTAQQTSIEGVYAAGDITPHSQLAIVAAAEGAMAAIHIHKSLTPIERQV